MGINWQSVMVLNRVKLAGIWPKVAQKQGGKRRFGKDAGHRDERPGGLLPPEQVNGATFAGGCKRERNPSTKFNRPVFPDGTGGLSPLESLALAGRRRAS